VKCSTAVAFAASCSSSLTDRPRVTAVSILQRDRDMLHGVVRADAMPMIHIFAGGDDVSGL
jgi:hypothetical protein